MFGSDEVLVPAKALIGAPGVWREPPYGDIIYTHICLDGHQVVWAEGAASETFYPGRQALRSLSATDLAAFRRTRFANPTDEWTPARPLVPVRPGAAFARLAVRSGQRFSVGGVPLRVAS